MGDDHLREVFEGMTQAELATWYKRRILQAKVIIRMLVARSRVSSATNTVDFPQAEEIVAETVRRILVVHSKRYRWNGEVTFEQFFGRCMKTTANGLRSAERNHRIGREKLDTSVDVYFATPVPGWRESVETMDDSIAQSQGSQVLAGAIASTRMKGAAVRYATKLHEYASDRLTTDEIARDLGVKASSVDSYRHRIRVLRMMKSKE